METLIIYLLKSAGLLSIFYLAYLLLLRNETFFSNNRKFLLSGILASFILPVVYFTRTIIINPSPVSIIPQFANSNPVPIEQTIDWWQLAGFIYFIVFSLLLLRFSLQLFRVIKLVISKDHTRDGKFLLIETSAEGPFSFFNYIIYNPEAHSVEELSMVLKHEKVHARQMHSVDILISHLACYVLWFNPLSWLYRKSITENLEYIADKVTVTETASKKEYLHTLVKVTMREYQPALTNSFYQPFIKKRIMMINKKTNNHNNIWKMGIVLPALLAFMLTFNVRTVAQVIDKDKNKVEVKELESSVVVTKESNDESLESLKKMMKKSDVVIEFSGIKRNDQGFITSINVDLLNKKDNTTGNYSVSDSDGISPFKIYVKENGQSGFESISEAANNRSRNVAFSKIGKDPLYIVNKKEYSSADLQGKTIQINNGLSILDSQEGNKVYGTKALEGVVIVSDGKIIDDFEAELKKIDSQEINFERSYLQINKGEKPTFIELNNGNPESKVTVQETNGTKITGTSSKIVYVVNGTPSSNTVVTQISPEKVENVVVYKGNSAQAYGAKTTAITKIYSADSTGTGFNYVNGTILMADSTGIYQKRNSSPTLVSFTPNDSTSTQIKLISVSGEEGEKPLFIVDGKVMPADFNSKDIDESEIESIMVWKNETATKKYGKKGKNGVIEIVTKEKKDKKVEKNKKVIKDKNN